jgi:hypothetical protein
MTNTQIIIAVAVATAIITALVASRRGPRVTQVDRTTTKRHTEGDER